MIRTILTAFLALAAALWAPTAAAAPPCLPLFYGEQIGNVTLERTDAGWYGHHYCVVTNAQGQRYTVPVGFACVHGTCLTAGAFSSLIASLRTSADPAGAAKARWDASFGTDCETATGTLKTVCDSMFKSARENRPIGAPMLPDPVAVPQFAVKQNLTSSTRPAYTLTSGVRGTKEVARATVGQPCKADRPTLASGSDLWAEFGPDFKPGVVALCSRK